MAYIDCPMLINNLGLFKIVEFGQVQSLWREKNNKMIKADETFFGKS